MQISFWGKEINRERWQRAMRQLEVGRGRRRRRESRLILNGAAYATLGTFRHIILMLTAILWRKCFCPGLLQLHLGLLRKVAGHVFTERNTVRKKVRERNTHMYLSPHWCIMSVVSMAKEREWSKKARNSADSETIVKLSSCISSRTKVVGLNHSFLWLVCPL